MGRSSNKRKRQQQQEGSVNHQNSNKRANETRNKRRKKAAKKRQRFWVEDCQDTKVPDDRIPDIDVLVTRVELEDTFWEAPSTSEPKKEEAKTADKNDDISPDRLPQSDSGPKSAGQVQVKVPNQNPGDDDKAPTDSSSTENAKESNKPEISRAEINAESSPCEKADKETPSLVCVRKAENAKRPLQRFYEEENFKPLANGDCGDGITNPFPKEEVADKFWAQRRRLFSRFDQGIRLDKESWFSVTPEAIADHIAAHLVGVEEDLTILDPFCGVCGNAIGFAKRKEVKLVVCVDVDLEKLKKAAWNAHIYDIPPEKILFIHSDAYTVLSMFKGGTLINKSSQQPEIPPMIEKGFRIIGQHQELPEKIDVVFLSPPWGGLNYLKVGKRNYDLKCIEVEHDDKKIDGEELLVGAAKAVGDGRPIAYFLPRNTNGVKFARSVLKAGCSGPVVMEQNVLNGKLKTVTAYIGL